MAHFWGNFSWHPELLFCSKIVIRVFAVSYLKWDKMTAQKFNVFEGLKPGNRICSCDHRQVVGPDWQTRLENRLLVMFPSAHLDLTGMNWHIFEGQRLVDSSFWLHHWQNQDWEHMEDFCWTMVQIQVWNSSRMYTGLTEVQGIKVSVDCLMHLIFSLMSQLNKQCC